MSEVSQMSEPALDTSSPVEHTVRSLTDLEQFGINPAAGFFYVMTPYAKYEKGHHAAWVDAVRLTASLMAVGLNVYSPIAHSHPVVQSAGGNIPATDNDYWFNINKPFMDACLGGIVIELPGWEESEGIRREIEYLKEQGALIMRMPFQLPN